MKKHGRITLKSGIILLLLILAVSALGVVAVWILTPVPIPKEPDKRPEYEELIQSTAPEFVTLSALFPYVKTDPGFQPGNLARQIRGERPTCAIIGSASNLRGALYGKTIDTYDYVFRLNEDPVVGHRNDVGSKTSFRVASSEFALKNDVIANKKLNNKNAMFILFDATKYRSKRLYDIYGKTLIDKPVMFVPMAFSHGLKEKWLHNSAKPSTELKTLITALNLCDQVTVYGFGPNEKRVWDHYYNRETVDACTSGTFNFLLEADVLNVLEYYDFITVERGVIPINILQQMHNDARYLKHHKITDPRTHENPGT